MPRDDINRLKHVVWDLIIARILIPGTPNSDQGWPFLSLTDDGLKVKFSERHPVPYDPDGYLARLQQATGGLSPTILCYLQEALSTFRSSNPPGLARHARGGVGDAVPSRCAPRSPLCDSRHPNTFEVRRTHRPEEKHGRSSEGGHGLALPE